MWFVDAIINFEFGVRERWEGLTKEQADDIHQRYYESGAGYIRSGVMEQ